ncbi:hypothetical protein HKBW3S43_01632, partial [Candidatus Hakubella thermalkaliphila]
NPHATGGTKEHEIKMYFQGKPKGTHLVSAAWSDWSVPPQTPGSYASLPWGGQGIQRSVKLRLFVSGLVLMDDLFGGRFV